MQRPLPECCGALAGTGEDQHLTFLPLRLGGWCQNLLPAPLPTKDALSSDAGSFALAVEAVARYSAAVTRGSARPASVSQWGEAPECGFMYL